MLLYYYYKIIVFIIQSWKYLRSQWGSNSHFYGSYSFHSMNTDKEGKANSQLAKPLINSNGKNVCDP